MILTQEKYGREGRDETSREAKEGKEKRRKRDAEGDEYNPIITNHVSGPW